MTDSEPSVKLDPPELPTTPTPLCGILKWPSPAQRGRRSYSESDQLQLMMSLTSISSIPEEEEEEEEEPVGSSTKKSVRFSEVVQRQVFRTNSSILGRKVKNSKKSEQKKRRALERRVSEGDVQNVDPAGLTKSKSWTSLHSNEDSGLASSVEECTTTMSNEIKNPAINNPSGLSLPENKSFSKEANLDLIFELDF